MEDELFEAVDELQESSNCNDRIKNEDEQAEVRKSYSGHKYKKQPQI